MTPVLEQSLSALAKGNEIRSARARVKERCRSASSKQGCRKVAEIILDPGQLWATCKVVDALRIPRQFGRVRAEKVCLRLGIGPEVSLGDLTGRQRLALAMVLDPDGAVDVVLGVAA